MRSTSKYVYVAGFAAALSAVCGPSVATASPRPALDFESLDDSAFLANHGRNSSETTITVSTEQAHQGKKAAKIAYKFTGAGYLELTLANPVEISEADGPITVSLWVYGAGKSDFASAGLRLIDAKNEVFQYPSPGFSDALNGTGWHRYEITLDPGKFKETWGLHTDNQIKWPLRFFGFGAGRADSSVTTGTVYVDQIGVDTSTPPVPKVALALSVGGDVPVVKPGDPVTVNATVNGAIDSLSAQWTVRDYDGKTLSQTTVPVTGPTVSTTFRAPASGLYYATCVVKQDALELAKAETRFAALRPIAPEAASAYYYGVNSHTERYPVPEGDKEIAMIALGGYNACRTGGAWSSIEPSEGQFNWSKLDHHFEMFAKNHILPVPGLAFSTSWATTGDPKSKDWHQWNNTPPVTEKFAAYVKTSVTRYKGYTKYWEVWNEPDLSSWLGTADQYATLLSAAIQAAHEADPDAKVMNGGVSEVYSYRPTFVPDFLRLTSPKPDVFAYHSHGSLQNMLVASKVVRGRLKDAGLSNLPVWLNESGFSSFGSNTEREQADVLVKKIATSRAIGDKAFMVYDIRNDGTDPNDPENNFGVIQKDFAPKPGYVSVHTLVETLGQKPYQGTLSFAPLVTAYTFASPGEAAVAYWSEQRGTTSGNGLLATNAKQAWVRDTMGRDTRLPIKDGYFSAPISFEPRFLRLVGTGDVWVKSGGDAISAPAVVSYTGSKATLTFAITNPLKTALSGSLSVGSDMVTSAAPPDFRLKPGESATLSTVLTVAPTASANQPVTIRLNPTSGLPPISQDVILRSAVAAPVVTSSSAPWAGEPQVRLGQANLVSLFTATPLDTLKFKGPADLSAAIRLRACPEGIQVRVEVTDDIHNQNETPDQMWKGDSVQLGLVTADRHTYEWCSGLTASGPVVTGSPSNNDENSGKSKVHALIVRSGTTTTYDLLLRSDNPDIKQAIQTGCSLDVLINDNDGAGRKGWLEWTPGIGMTKDSSFFVPVAFVKP